MKKISLRNYLSELLGTLALVATIIGAGFMTQNLQADPTTGLLMIALAAGASLAVLIYLFGPFSGAHLNPAVTLAFWLRKKISSSDAAGYIIAQFLGAVLGAVLANLMFERAVISASPVIREGYGQWLGEVVATTGLVLLILVLAKRKQGNLIAPLVGLWIVAGHFFTSSTSFANPAVTLGRALTESPVGIAWSSVGAFMLAQLVGALVAVGVFFGFKNLSKKGK
jgi:glycerol uptake facilitator-like aquaporin